MDHSIVLVLADPTDPLLAMLEALPGEVRIAAGNRVEAFADAAPEADVILNWTGTVSYTHLDVYKRQSKASPLLCHNRDSRVERRLWGRMVSCAPIVNRRKTGPVNNRPAG